MTTHPDPLFELHTGSSLRPTDDLISLKQHVAGGQFRYVDIAIEQSRQQALRRWPLLSELDRAHQQLRRQALTSSDQGSRNAGHGEGSDP